MSPTEVMVDGNTRPDNAHLWENGGGREFFNITVRASDTDSSDRLESIRRELRAELPEEPLKVSYENGNVFRGTVQRPHRLNRAVKIASTRARWSTCWKCRCPMPAADPAQGRFASVDRTMEKQLGINIFSSGFGNTLGAVSAPASLLRPPSAPLAPGPTRLHSRTI